MVETRTRTNWNPPVVWQISSSAAGEYSLIYRLSLSLSLFLSLPWAFHHDGPSRFITMRPSWSVAVKRRIVGITLLSGIRCTNTLLDLLCSRIPRGTHRSRIHSRATGKHVYTGAWRVPTHHSRGKIGGRTRVVYHSPRREEGTAIALWPLEASERGLLPPAPVILPSIPASWCYPDLDHRKSESDNAPRASWRFVFIRERSRRTILDMISLSRVDRSKYST